MSNLIVGLTGGIGSGKSAAMAAFQALGIEAIDADQAAREVVEPGTPALTAIADHFGSQILLADGRLNRAQLREIIFNNPAEKAWLEALLHPLIREHIVSFLQKAVSPYALLVSPLLVESGQVNMVERVIVVDVPESTQVARTMARDQNDEALVKSIMASQTKRETRLQAADFVINNSGSLQELQQQVNQIHTELLAQTRDTNTNREPK
ncbi:dephospho-CoA kinase [Halioxenophilus sp. WMMB6]|uniref:dephospho-CoA kinase n=1 Tax=Halioxenophilus sp. WMMB6 TaxID=3073815 RepID=UPI00295EF1A5|nr:dephospho-CoA kinase [Halioxenophilus sp. WMMB6]